jgi:hypothetical protein
MTVAVRSSLTICVVYFNTRLCMSSICMSSIWRDKTHLCFLSDHCIRFLGSNGPISHSSDAPEEMGTPVKRRGRPPGSRNKNTLAKEATTGPATSVKSVTTPAAGDRAVVAQKRKRVEYECDVVTFLRRGGISILEALAVKLPDVLAAEILPKLDVNDTLRLAQVNKAYNDTVWSVEGVRSMEAKIKALHRKSLRLRCSFIQLKGATGTF